MNIFKKLKSFITKEKSEAPYIDICDLVLNTIESRKKNLGIRPKNIPKDEWLKILNDIAFGFKCKKDTIRLKSIARRKQRERKIKRAFELFEIYIKDL